MSTSLFWHLLLLATLLWPRIVVAGQLPEVCDQLFVAGFEDSSASPPVSVAGPDQAVLRGNLVALDGSASSGMGNLGYCWQLLERPAGSTASLSNPLAVDPSFIADQPGDYLLRLTVFEGMLAGQADLLRVSARAVSQLVEPALGEQLVSADHRLTLDIAAGGVIAPTSIGISLEDPQALPELASALAVYELSPAGLDLLSPAPIRWRQARLGEIEPKFLVHQHDGMLSLVDGLYQAEADRESLDGEVEGFSRLAAIVVPFLRLSFDPVFAVGVGQDFSLSYRGTAFGAPTGFEATTSRTGGFALAPQLQAPPGTPAVVADLRYDEDLSLSAPATLVDSARIGGRCVAPGTARIAVQVRYSRGLLATLLPTLQPGPDPVIRLLTTVRCIQLLTPPIARDDQVSIGFGSAPIVRRVPVLGNDHDADGSLVPASVEIITAPRFGAAVPQPDGSILVTTAGFRLQERLSYRVRDNDGLISNVAEVLLTRSVAPNAPPIAMDDSHALAGDTPAVLDVLGNDIDPDGALDPGSLMLLQAPLQGQVQVQADGSLRYTPNAGFRGSDSLRYRISDDLGAMSGPADVSLQIGDPVGPPQVHIDAAQTAIDTPVDIDVLANDANFDPATLAYVGPPGEDAAIVQNGSGNPLLRFTPALGFAGTVQLQYRVASSDGQVSPPTVVEVLVIDPDNQPPVAVDDAAQVARDSSVQIFVLLNDFDPDSLISAGSESVVQPPVNGVANSAVAGPGAIQYTPNPGFVGVDSFTYTVADAFGAVSNQATVSVTVLDQTFLPPVAMDDPLFIAPETQIRFYPLINDLPRDGNLLPGSLAIVQAPLAGSATRMDDGSIHYQPDPGFIGIDALTYTISDDRGMLSNVATVTIDVRPFLGDADFIFDNISAAEVNFFGIFGQTFQDQGIGGFYGFFHGDQTYYQNGITQIGDHTWLFGFPSTSEMAAASSYDMVTDLQGGVATFQPDFDAFSISGFAPGPLYPASGGSFSVAPVGSGVVGQVSAPPPVIDGNGNPTVIQGDFAGLASVFGAPDGSFSHLLVRFESFQPNGNLITGLLARIPASEMNLVGGIRQRELLDARTRQMLAYRGIMPTQNVAIVFYNLVNNDSVFTGVTQRSVPMGAGRGISLPAVQLQAAPPACQNVRVNTLCQGGPREVLLAANANGDVTVHSADDGSLLFQLLGEPAPNFDIISGWEIAQDPLTNCLLYTDTSGDDVVRYNTDGSTVDSPFISVAGGSGGTAVDAPRSLAFVDGEVWVVSNSQGRVIRFDALTGAFLGERVTGAGRPSGLIVEADGDLILTDDSFSSGSDQVRLYPADGSAARVLIGGGLGTPYQLTPLFDGNYALSIFGNNQVRVFNDGAANLATVTIGSGAQGNYNPRGMQPLRNGNWLVSANNGGGVAEVDPSEVGTGYLRTIVPGSSFRSITRACFPAE